MYHIGYPFDYAVMPTRRNSSRHASPQRREPTRTRQVSRGRAHDRTAAPRQPKLPSRGLSRRLESNRRQLGRGSGEKEYLVFDPHSEDVRQSRGRSLTRRMDGLSHGRVNREEWNEYRSGMQDRKHISSQRSESKPKYEVSRSRSRSRPRHRQSLYQQAYPDLADVAFQPPQFSFHNCAHHQTPARNNSRHHYQEDLYQAARPDLLERRPSTHRFDRRPERVQAREHRMQNEHYQASRPDLVDRRGRMSEGKRYENDMYQASRPDLLGYMDETRLPAFGQDGGYRVARSQYGGVYRPRRSL